MTYIENLISFNLVQPGDRVFAGSYLATPHGWGTVVINENSGGWWYAGNKYVYVKFDDFKVVCWGTRAERITEWKPAEGRLPINKEEV